MARVVDKVLLDGSMTRNNTMVYGMYKGYYTTVHMLAGGQIYMIRMNYRLPENFDIMGFKNRANQYINSMKVAEKKISTANVMDHTIEIQVAISSLVKDTIAMIDRITNGLAGMLASESALSGCQSCGTDFGVNCFDINGEPRFLCSGCSQTYVSQMEAEKQSKLADKSNPVLGIIGAIIGALLGSIFWVILGQVGYIAGIAGIAILLGAMKGYTLLGKSLDKKGVIITLLISFVMVYVANDITWRIAVQRVISESGRHLSYVQVMRNSDAWGRYYGDLAIGYFLFIIAGFSYVIQAFKNASGNYHIKRL